MAKDNKALEVSDLETATTVEETTAKARKPKKELTAEEVAELKANLEAGVEKMTEFGVSEKFAKVLAIAIDWQTASGEDLAAAKEAMISSFESEEEFKNYMTDEFGAELAVFQGMNKLASTLNNVKSFYARRPGVSAAGSRKRTKLMQISISGVNYNVSEEYFAEIAELPKDEKIAALLAHPATAKIEAVEVL